MEEVDELLRKEACNSYGIMAPSGPEVSHQFVGDETRDVLAGRSGSDTILPKSITEALVSLNIKGRQLQPMHQPFYEMTVGGQQRQCRLL